MPSPSIHLITANTTPRPESRVCDGCYRPALVLTVRRNSWLCPNCLTQFPISARELENRQRVALKLVAVLEDCGGDPNSLQTMSESDWELAAKAAKVELPSLETRSVVAAIIRGGKA